MNKRVILVDDEKSILEALKREFKKEQYALYTYTNPIEALDAISDIEPAVVVSDQRMPDMEGVEFLGKVRLRYPSVIRIVLTGYTDVDSIMNAINKGNIYRFITKPWNRDDLLITVKNAVNYFNLTLENYEQIRSLKLENEMLKKVNAAMNETLNDCTALIQENESPDSAIKELERRILEMKLSLA